MPEAEVIRILLEYEDLFTQSNIFQFIMRFLGWGIIKGLSFIVDSAQGSLEKAMEMLNFFDSEAVTNIIGKVTPFAGIFIVVSLLYIGYNLMLNRKKFDRSKIPLNIIIAIIIVVLLPTVMTELGKITKYGFKLFTTEQTTLSNEIISNNIKDLYLYDLDNFRNKNIHPTNYINKDNIKKIDPTEEIDRSNVKNKKVFQNEVKPAIGKGEFELNRINGWFKMDSEYYRWDINFFTIMFTLLISGVVIIFTIVKFIKLSAELAFSKIFTIGGAFADIAHGQKTKQMLMHILGLYIAIMATGLTLNLYIVATGYMSNRVGGFTSILVNLALALFVIDGPNLLEKVFGVDAGLSSGLRLLMGINSGLDILSKMKNGLGGAVNLTKNALEKGAVLGAGLKGFKDGAFSNLEDDIRNSEQSGFNPLTKELPGENIKSLAEDLGEDNNFGEDDSITNNPNTPNDDSSGGLTFDEVMSNELANDYIDNHIPTLEDDINDSEYTNLAKSDGLNDNFADENEVLSDFNNSNIDENNIPTLEDNIGYDDSNSPIDKENNDLVDGKTLNSREPSKINNNGIDENNIPNLDDDIKGHADNPINRNDMKDSIMPNAGISKNLNNDMSNNNLDNSLSEGGLGERLDNQNVESNNVPKLNKDSLSNDIIPVSNNKAKNEVLPKSNNDWQYYDKGQENDSQAYKEWSDFKNFAEGRPFANRPIYNEPNYIDSNETRNIKELLSGAMRKKVNSIKDSELSNKMKFSYTIGNNTAKDLNRYVGIKKEEVKDKIVAERIRRNL